MNDSGFPLRLTRLFWTDFFADLVLEPQTQLNPEVKVPNGTLAVHKLPYDGTRPNRIG